MKKKILVILAVLTTFVLCLSVPSVVVQGAALKNDPPIGFTDYLPEKKEAGVAMFEDFENAEATRDGSVNGLYGTGCDNPDIGYCQLSVTDEASHSGKKSLKVSDRKEGEGMGYNTFGFDGLGDFIAQNFVADSANLKKTDTYFFTAWIKNVDPQTTQTFLFTLLYGGSGEVWIPGGDYYTVTGSEWTQVGVTMQNGKAYYNAFVEDAAGSGIYPMRNSTTGSVFKGVTRDSAGVGTNGDFYIDDIVIWKVDDESKLLNAIPIRGENSSEESSNTSKDNSESSDTSGEDKKTESEASLSVVMIILIGAVVVLLLVVCAGVVYFIMQKKKKAE